MLYVAVEYDALVSADVAPQDAVSVLRKRPIGEPVYEKLLDAVSGAAIKVGRWVSTEVPVNGLEAGMVAEEPIVSSGGFELLPGGRQVTQALVDRLRSFRGSIGVQEPIAVRILVED